VTESRLPPPYCPVKITRRFISLRPPEAAAVDFFDRHERSCPSLPVFSERGVPLPFGLRSFFILTALCLDRSLVHPLMTELYGSEIEKPAGRKREAFLRF